MGTINTVAGQSIYDIALECYGTTDAVAELLQLNDLGGKMDLPDYVPAGEIDLAFSLLPGVEIIYDETSPLYNAAVVKKLSRMRGRVITGISAKYRVFSTVFSTKFN